MGTQAKTDAQAFRQAEQDLDDLAGTALGGVEGLDRASCSPAVTYLAQVGIGAAARGCSCDGWRTEVGKIRGEHAAQELDAAERCMRESGLWPWL